MAEKSGRPQFVRETTVCCVCRGRLTAYHDDEGDERQERGLDWELEEDKILPTIGR